MKYFKFSATNGKRFLFTLSIDGPDHDITPPNPVALKHLADLRRLLPVTRKGKPITFHERHASRLAQWLRLLIFQGEGVDLTVEEARDVKKKWPPWEVRERDEYS